MKLSSLSFTFLPFLSYTEEANTSMIYKETNNTTRMKLKAVAVTVLGVGLILADMVGFCHGELYEGFYRGKCGFADVEVIVSGVVNSWFIRDPSSMPALVRLQFHDCFVNGCDASILLDGRNSEKVAVQNQRIRGYDIIDEAKAAVEKICPGLVSCADIIVIAARDAVFLSGGGRYEVQTGRRDGLISLANNAQALPPPSASVSDCISAFAKRGLSSTDMAVLLGAHSIGVTHCSQIQSRLYNFDNTGHPDPAMDPFLLQSLRFRCPPNANEDRKVDLDQFPLSPRIMDISYYKQLLVHRGILRIDQELALDQRTRTIVRNLADALDFPSRFGVAMVKLGAVEVLTGRQGEIRRSCRAVNN